MKTRFKIIPIVVSGLLFVISAVVHAEVSKFELGGIMVDSASPSASIAVINGDSVLQGDTVGEYRIREIHSRSVKLEHLQTGEERTITMKEVQRAPAPVVDPALGESGEALEDEALEPKQGVLAKILAGPKNLKNLSLEIMAIRRLAMISNAAVKYHYKMDFFPRQMKQLTLDGFLPESYNKEVSMKYRYYFDSLVHPDGLGIHADPIDPDSGMKFFFIGNDAVIRFEETQVATKNSPIFEAAWMKQRK